MLSPMRRFAAVVTTVLRLATTGCSSSFVLQALVWSKRIGVDVDPSVDAAISERVALARNRMDAVKTHPGFIGWGQFSIPSGNMEDTLLIGDENLVAMFEPLMLVVERGDIVVFEYPIDGQETFVKRVVGIPGDRLRIADKHLFRNGEKVVEPYVRHKTAYTIDYRDNFPAAPDSLALPPAHEMLEKYVEGDELLVPDGHYFVLGDSRDLSLDSRYWGYLPEALIRGRVEVVYWSEDAPFELFQEPGFEPRGRLDRVGIMPR